MHDIGTRRVVTGHDANGNAVFIDDKDLTSLNPRDNKPQSGGFYGTATVYKTDGVPPMLNCPYQEWYGKSIGITDPTGVICRTVHFPPQGPVPDDYNIMHRTQSVDIGIVISGEIELHLDHGVMKTLKKGDVVVQRGTIHQWVNVSKEYCVMAFVLIPSKDKVKVEETGIVIEPTAYPAL